MYILDVVPNVHLEDLVFEFRRDEEMLTEYRTVISLLKKVSKGNYILLSVFIYSKNCVSRDVYSLHGLIIIWTKLPRTNTPPMCQLQHGNIELSI